MSKLVPQKWCNFIADYPEIYQETLMDPSKQIIHLNEKYNVAPKFPMSLARQSHNIADKEIMIPNELMEIYHSYRPTPLKRAVRLEKALSTKKRIYYKFEGANVSGSHKLNTALAQAYYFKKAGVKHIVTGTGAGQWGTAIAYAAKLFGLGCTVFMVNVSLNQKPQRRSMIELYGAKLYSSPSKKTEVGLKSLSTGIYESGSLAIATAEAIEYAASLEKAQFAVGSGENHVLLHQTIIGNEAINQLDEFDDFPDKVYACMGAGSNFAGVSLPILRCSKQKQVPCRFIAVEPEACPKLTKGVFAIDRNDYSGTTPYSKMYTLGSQFIAPPPIHAGGLRYHGTSEFLSALHYQGIIHSKSVSEENALSAGEFFSIHEGILPAPESAYAIAAALQDIKVKNNDSSILINISGHGLFDVSAYSAYKNNQLENDIPDEKMLEKSLQQLKKFNQMIKQ